MEGHVFGRYQITHKLGEGGMADVWAAKHQHMDRDAAIKLLQPEMSAQPDIVKRFFQEAQAAAKIKDPGTVEVFDVGYTPHGRAYVVMERLIGETLNQRLKRHGALGLEQAVVLMRQLARAMGAAHDSGIIHRDLKPDNLFLVRDPEVGVGERIKVLDFGLAKLARASGSVLTMEGTVFGTPAYMAPEQCRDAANVDHRADLYSIGCIFYRCLCGRPPFGSGGVEVLRAHLRDEPTSPRALDPTIPVAVDRLILWLLAKSPDDRVQSCAELMVLLDNKRSIPTARDAVPMAHEDNDTARAAAPGDPTAPQPMSLEDATLQDMQAILPMLDEPDGIEADDSTEAPTLVHVPNLPRPRAEPGSAPSVNAGEIVPTMHRRRQRWLLWGLGAMLLGAVVAGSIAAALDPADGEQAKGKQKAAPTSDHEATPQLEPTEPEVHEEQAAVDVDAGPSAEEAGHRASLEQLARAAEAGDIAGLVKHYGDIPRSSAHHGEATEMFHNARDRWFADTHQLAGKLAESAKCDDLDALVAEIKAGFADKIPDYEPLQAQCRKRLIKRQVADAAQAIGAHCASGDYKAALQRCNQDRRKLRREVKTLMLCGMAACQQKDRQAAAWYHGKLPPQRRGSIFTRCLREGIDLAPKAAANQ